MIRNAFLALLVLATSMGFARFGFAEEVQRDVVSVQGFNRSYQPQNRKKQVKEWFESMGIDTTGDGLAQNMYHLMAGINEKISPTSDFTVSAGTGVRMGVTF